MRQSPGVKPLSSDQVIGVIVVDHGSRRAASNELLLDVVASFQKTSSYDIVEPAHMELAEPSLAVAFDRCVGRGATHVVVHPYFLLPGRHWDSDIPRLAAEAASRHPGISYLVTAPLGLHPLMAKVMAARIEQCLLHATREGESCELCTGTAKCQFRGEARHE